MEVTSDISPVPHAHDQVGPGRFSTFTADVEGLFLVGAGTISGGIMSCVTSGVLAAEKAAGLLAKRS
jgi:phytoene dehydrogenase-like protein